MDLEGLGHLSVDTTAAFEDRGKIVSSSTRFPYTTRLFVLLNLIGVPVIVFTRSATISLSLSLCDRHGRTPSSRDSPRDVSHVYLKARGDRRL